MISFWCQWYKQPLNNMTFLDHGYASIYSATWDIQTHMWVNVLHFATLSAPRLLLNHPFSHTLHTQTHRRWSCYAGGLTDREQLSGLTWLKDASTYRWMIGGWPLYVREGLHIMKCLFACMCYKDCKMFSASKEWTVGNLIIFWHKWLVFFYTTYFLIHAFNSDNKE